MQVYKFAIVGYGYIGKRHAEIIKSNPYCELIGVCDSEYKEVDVPFYFTLEELLTKDFDVLCVCTPNGLHFEHAWEGILKGKHVIIEKPIALNPREATMLKAAAQSKGVNIFCVMQNRYSPPSQWVKSVIPILGKIYSVKIDCYWNRDERYYKGWKGSKLLDGGTLFTQFSHFIDIMYWLFGDITNVQSKFNDFNHSELTDFEDSGNIIFDFVNGGSGVFNFSTSVFDCNLESTLTIIAENGTIKIGGQYMDKVEYCNIKDYTMPELKPCNPPNDYGYYKGSAMNHNYIYDNVINVLNDTELITTSVDDGIAVVSIIEKMYTNQLSQSYTSRQQ